VPEGHLKLDLHLALPRIVCVCISHYKRGRFIILICLFL
jgi:hypothetical protein